MPGGGGLYVIVVSTRPPGRTWLDATRRLWPETFTSREEAEGVLSFYSRTGVLFGGLDRADGRSLATVKRVADLRREARAGDTPL